ncbi:MAG: hypothetical protein GH145_02730 [Firmicutes bacterium]|nr:hypothetical protein [Bacillota bacterium]
MQTTHLSRPNKPTGQPALVNSGDFGGRLVHILPQTYLEEGFRMVEDHEFRIRLVIPKEELDFL